jgi:hypothetical protein
MRAGSDGQRPSDEEKNIPMPAMLQERLLTPENKPQVLADCYTLIEQEVASKSGISGTAVKVAYKTVSTIAPGHIHHMVKSLLPQLVAQLQPYWDDFSASGSGEFSEYLTKRSEEVAESLLSVTDARAAASSRPTVIKAYRTVRGGAAKHVQAALPRVADLVVKYAA